MTNEKNVHNIWILCDKLFFDSFMTLSSFKLALENRGEAVIPIAKFALVQVQGEEIKLSADEMRSLPGLPRARTSWIACFDTFSYHFGQLQDGFEVFKGLEQNLAVNCRLDRSTKQRKRKRERYWMHQRWNGIGGAEQNLAGFGEMAWAISRCHCFHPSIYPYCKVSSWSCSGNTRRVIMAKTSLLAQEEASKRGKKFDVITLPGTVDFSLECQRRFESFFFFLLLTRDHENEEGEKKNSSTNIWT